MCRHTRLYTWSAKNHVHEHSAHVQEQSVAGHMIHLVRLLKSDNTAVRTEAFKMIWFATRCDDFKNLFTKDAFVNPMLSVLRRSTI